MIRINNTWIKIALLNFLIVATLGTFLRFAFIKELTWMDYLHFQTAHWHLAVFGWIYQAMYVFIIGAFLTPEQQAQKKYHTLFWLNQTLIIIVFLTLITKGYSFFSVDEDICFVVLIGGFVFSILKDLKISSGSNRLISNEFLKIAFFFLLLSFLGIISIIPIELLFSAKRSIFYYLSSQFFLHFQYNGWFIFGILSLFFKMIENYGIKINTDKFRQFKRLLLAAALITYFLNIYWGYPGHLVFLWIASLGGGMIQITALFIVRKDISMIFGELKPHLNSVTAVLMKFAYISFCIKLILQVVIAYPDLASVALTIRNYTIAYFHLVFLCIASVFLFAWNVQFNKLKLIQKNSNTGIYVFSFSILSVELLLFLQGTLLWIGVGFMTFYYELIFLLTLGIPISIVLIIFQNIKHSNFGDINK